MPSIEKLVVDGASGAIEVAFDWPAKVREATQSVRGVAYIGHPHPLYGGTLDNKVVATIARSFAGLGWLAVRFNFRGVGKSAGEHDEGNGETEDFLYLIDTVPKLPAVSFRLPSSLPIAVAGFSFGSFVAAKAAHALSAATRPVRHVVLIGAAAGKWAMPAVAPDALVIHGELDETIRLVDVLDWARPQELPIVVIPGADHFFHRRLGLLKRLISAHILGMPAIDAAPQSD
jgi:alpha/beta superfamily hydrolase